MGQLSDMHIRKGKPPVDSLYKYNRRGSVYEQNSNTAY